ncbi:MAG TPA: DNA recombination/repair protein RecA, partial [bacterium]|nr:DNA recombination/repair protein RecA [bacterium]
IFINQIREKIGGFSFGGAIPETTPGGRALKFYSSVRLDVRRIGSIKRAEQVIGIRVLVKVSKNKVAPPFQRAEMDMYFDEGISREVSLLETGETMGLVSKSGVWFLYEKERLGQGKEAARQYLKEHPEIASKIEEAIRAKAFPSGE